MARLTGTHRHLNLGRPIGSDRCGGFFPKRLCSTNDCRLTNVKGMAHPPELSVGFTLILLQTLEFRIDV